MFSVVIIGGMAAGCKAAARLSRLCSEYDITIIERSGYVSFGNCGLPLFASGEIDDFYALSKTPYGVIRDEEYFKSVKGIKVLKNTEVEEVDPLHCEVKCHNLNEDHRFSLNYNALIFATGSTAIEPQFPVPDSPRVSQFYSPEDAKRFKITAREGSVKKAVIIGGGFIGSELTESLSALWGIETVLVEKEKYMLQNLLDYELSRIVENRIKSNGVKIITSCEVQKVFLNSSNLPVVVLENGEEIKSDYVFYNLGVKPNTALAVKTGVEVGPHGGILVDKKMRTNLPNIWAAGDCVEAKNIVTGKTDYYTMGSLSNRMAREAADSINGKNTTDFKGTIGSVSLKIFDLIVCTTGLTELKARKSGYDVESMLGCWSDRPEYHPEAKNLFAKIIYEKQSLKLLGLQIAGEGEVTRYIDIFSNLLANYETALQLINLEHAYTPAHSSPLSPLNYLGYMIINQEKEGLNDIKPAEVADFAGNILDVREEFEITQQTRISNVRNIPLSNLRASIGEIEFDKPIICFCSKGPRSYEAARYLKCLGHNNARYLSGGLLFFN
jgi:NADPH-dependent 2,4-dienoyl-CoA reductase/sulfur reductase-like enzyme/rhodanese-related sulfurtransferase